MRIRLTVIICSSLLHLVLAGCRCTTDTECRCGHVCVKRGGREACQDDGTKCKCKRGCWLANEYFRPGETRNVFCNTCTCSVDRRQITGSVLSCTRMAWCDLPTDIPLYPEKPACPGDSIR